MFGVEMYFFIILLVTSYIGISSQDGAHKWSYAEQDKWPGKCRHGKLQSPINIDSTKAVVDRGTLIQAPLDFRRYTSVELQGHNNGHTVRFDMEGSPDEGPVLRGGPLQRPYVFDQLHFHWVSEHAIDNNKYNVEIHLVHHRRDMVLREAKGQKDGLVVIGVMARVSSDPADDWALKEIIDYVTELEKINSTTLTAPVNIKRLLSAEPDSYYTYSGSLTTPDCDETVTWIVMDRPIAITDEQFKIFTHVNMNDHTNYRELQHLNHRNVYRSMQSASSVSSTRPHPIIAGLITTATGLMAIAHGAVACLAAIIRKTAEKVIKMKKTFTGIHASGV